MYYTGFADEAGKGIDQQIKATKALGWKYIESRNIDGVNIHNLSDEQFEIVVGKLTAAGVEINCFGSEIANWARDPLKKEDFQASVEMLQRAIPRMKRLGAKMLRGMSFVVRTDRCPDDPEIEENVFRKVNHLVKMCEDAGIVYGHENCRNYGGQSYEHTLRLLDKVNSPAFKLIFDTGNPVFSDLRIGPAPYTKQNAWVFYKNVREFIHYVHIKDAVFLEDSAEGFAKSRFTWPGEGHGHVKEIVADLIKNGYDGGWSMEPHMALVFHEKDSCNEEQAKYDNYVEYGQRFMKIVEAAKAAAGK